MKLPGLRRSNSKRLNEALVREREGLNEKKLEVAALRANLVHEEYKRNVKEVYDFTEGKDAKEVGGFGEVQVVRHRQSQAKYAMKTVALARVKSRQGFDFVMSEVDLLKSLDHPNIVRLQEVYVTNSHLYMAMDLIEGGNLAGRCRFKGEEKAAVVVRQIVRALRYLHDRNIAHRDLKLENILLEANAEEGGVPSVKLVDFGLSAIFEENGMSTDVLGSWNYVAPEVIKGRYRPAPADMWSLGVVAYVLISGVLPFNADSLDLIKHKISEARFAFPEPAWAGTSAASKHFIRSLLLKSPELRLAAEDAQQHAWLKGAEEESQTPRKDLSFREQVTRNMVDFRQANGMKQLALEVVARTLDQGQIRLLTEEFDRADNNNNGEVSLSEFKRWLEANGAARGMTNEEVETLFKAVDVDNSGSIHFNEFLAATIQQRQLDEAQLWPAFDRLDRSHTGFINVDDVTLTTGAAATKQEAAVLIGYFDNNGDGQISFGEFVNGMRRMIGTERDDNWCLPLLPSPCPAASSPHLLPENAIHMPDKSGGGDEITGNSGGGEEILDNTGVGEEMLDGTRGGGENSTRGEEDNATLGRENHAPPSEQVTAVAMAEGSVPQPPDHDEVSAREGGGIDSEIPNEGDTQVLKDSHKSGDGYTQVLKKEPKQGVAVEVAVESIRTCRRKGAEILEESPAEGGAMGVAPVVSGESAVETSGGEVVGQRPDMGQGTSGDDASGDDASGGAERRQNYRRGCGGCVVG